MISSLIQKVTDQVLLFISLASNPKFWLILATDIILLLLAHYIAYVIRFADTIRALEFFHIISLSTFISLPFLLICVKIPVFYSVGLYRGMWRYTSYSDIINILKGTIYGAASVVLLLLFVNRFIGYPRSIFILDTLLTFIFITSHRVGIRYFYKNLHGPRRLFTKKISHNKKRLLLVGAGSPTEKVIRGIQDNRTQPYVAVGLVDDDPGKTGLKIHGVPVVGLVEDLQEHVLRTKAQEILIAVSPFTGSEMHRIVQLCQDTGIPYKVLPGIDELIDGKVSIKSIRDISYSDLLGRKEVKLEVEKIGNYLNDKVVLVTGAGGTIGSELCRQILRFSPKTIILFDAGEENLYSIQMKLRLEHNFHNTLPVLGKVQDHGLLELVFQQYKPSVVFHAAAYKHVPLVENNPWQAIHNNVFAAQLLIEASISHGVERFVLVSTDKAVRPTNVMGASKRLTELLMLAYAKDNWDGTFSVAQSRLRTLPIQSAEKKVTATHNTIFMAVRFGNVLGSSGSVIPLFKRQVEMGGPVTVTHPEITRYFMSIEEAAQLILQAGAMGRGQEIFILKMGKPVKIAQMAKDIIRLAGRQPGTEIEIKFTGLRDGEKLYEELITEGEGIVETKHEKIMVLQGNGTNKCSELFEKLEYLKQKTKSHDSIGIKDLLQQIIPEYNPDYKAKSINLDSVQ